MVTNLLWTVYLMAPSPILYDLMLKHTTTWLSYHSAL